MTATALDAGLCLLLVSAAALTVVGTRDPRVTPGRADAAAETLSVTTVAVDYSLAPAARDAGASVTDGGELDRVAHGTLAELLARVAFRNVTVEGEPLTNASTAFRHAVRRAVLDALPPRTRVDARWVPYRGAHVRGRVAVGPTPPADRAVDAARVTVPVHVPPPRRGGTTGTAGDAGRHQRLAALVVRGLFPPERMRFALYDDPPLPSLVVHRYRRAGECYDVALLDALRDGGPAAANERLRRAVAERARTDLRERGVESTTPRATNRPGRVVVVVRTWSP